ncbi:MAG: DUF418 domain-containing protein [Lachnospiraceae bacterium]|nr:DUF418 domain-containing protein [Lachnospiraceae bacterium]
MFGVFCLAEKKFGKLLKPFCNVGKLSLTLYVIQIVVGWLGWLIDADGSLIYFGAIPFGDFIVAIFVITLSCILMMLKNEPIETMMRKFEKKFI